jgi:hypothetical protein
LTTALGSHGLGLDYSERLSTVNILGLVNFFSCSNKLNYFQIHACQTREPTVVRLPNNQPSPLSVTQNLNLPSRQGNVRIKESTRKVINQKFQEEKDENGNLRYFGERLQLSQFDFP